MIYSNMEPKAELPGCNEAAETLEAAYPDPTNGFEPLTPYAVRYFSKLVMQWMHKLCEDRGFSVDFSYWEACTLTLLSADSNKNATIVPSRAGFGKSTWILALLLASCDLNQNMPAFARSLGGLVLVVQKIETLNEILHCIEHYFPDSSSDLVAMLQGWSQSGQQNGFCRNQLVNSFEQCHKQACPYASDCQILQFNQHGDQAYIVGITQARFNLLRRNQHSLDALLKRTTEQGETYRRFIIFDEKFDFAQTATLQMETINNASSHFERVGHDHCPTDQAVRKMQAGLSFYVQRIFQQLRVQTVFDNGQDQPFGFCRIPASENSNEYDSFLQYKNSFAGARKYFVSPALQDALDVIEALYHGRCIFSKRGNFRIQSTKPVSFRFGQAQTIIFDATAGIDGDYLHLPNKEWLPASPALHMDHITFHVYQHPALNVSRNAMKKSWKLPGFSELIEEIISRYPTRTFLCCYKDFAVDLLSSFSAETAKYLATMPDNSSCLPYFGGTNGANQFNDCHNVILFGYPRYDPSTYLLKAYAVWRDYGLGNTLEELVEKLATLDQIPKDVLRQIPLLQEYENRHLAARFEQEIYRCALRNQNCGDIHVFLFCPPKQVLQLLLSRFDGSMVEYDYDLPACIARHKNGSRSYGGRPTAYRKLSEFLHSWDGHPFTPAELREQLDISKSAWVDLRKSPHFNELLVLHGITQRGRGRYATFYRLDGERSA